MVASWSWLEPIELNPRLSPGGTSWPGRKQGRAALVGQNTVTPYVLAASRTGW